MLAANTKPSDHHPDRPDALQNATRQRIATRLPGLPLRYNLGVDILQRRASLGARLPDLSR